MKPRFTKSRERLTPATQSVARALGLLRSFTAARPEWGLSELAAEHALNKATVFRLLGALEADGFVARRAETATFRLGPALIPLGLQASRSIDLHAAARAALEALASRTGESATIEVLVGDEVLIVDEVHGRFLLSSTPETGMRFAAHATSTGKVLLAARRHEAVDGAGTGRAPAASRAPLARLAPNTVTSPARLEVELAAIWRQGYAVCDGEIEEGFVAIAAPVRDASGRTVASLSIGGPGARLTRAVRPRVVALVREAAEAVSQRLGAPARSPTPAIAGASTVPASRAAGPAARAPRARQ